MAEKETHNAFQRDEKGRPPWWWARLETLKMHQKNKFSGYPHAIEQIRKMARGEEPEEGGRQYFQGWEPRDFKWLLQELGEQAPE